ncbi:hypothetical protein MHBO_000191 [Bonamia ostreae]|uniref:Uncharacterized protein n=1 Tax=Bonamia ostreae TaxID=126728 RepID=A0ABV2AEQ4_9EUKA
MSSPKRDKPRIENFINLDRDRMIEEEFEKRFVLDPFITEVKREPRNLAEVMDECETTEDNRNKVDDTISPMEKMEFLETTHYSMCDFCGKLNTRFLVFSSDFEDLKACEDCKDEVYFNKKERKNIFGH